jgi:hypothetical protein
MSKINNKQKIYTVIQSFININITSMQDLLRPLHNAARLDGSRL